MRESGAGPGEPSADLPASADVTSTWLDEGDVPFAPSGGTAVGVEQASGSSSSTSAAWSQIAGRVGWARRAAFPAVVGLVAGLVFLSYRARPDEVRTDGGDDPQAAAPALLDEVADEAIDDLDEPSAEESDGEDNVEDDSGADDGPGLDRDEEDGDRGTGRWSSVSGGVSDAPSTTEAPHRRASSTVSTTGSTTGSTTTTRRSSTSPPATRPPTTSSPSTTEVTTTTTRPTTTTTRPTTTTTRPTTTTTRPTTTTTRPTTTTLGANLIGNGGFEIRNLPSGFTMTAVPPWSSSAGRVEVWRSGHEGVSSPSGSHHAELNVDDATTYSQTLATNRRGTYRWTLLHRGRNDTDALEVLIDGKVVTRISTGTSWTQYEGTFVASSGSTVFALRSVDGGGSANLIDAVTVREIVR